MKRRLIIDSSSPKRLLMSKSTERVRKKSEWILKKTAFSKFTNDSSNPVLIDISIEDSELLQNKQEPNKKAEKIEGLNQSSNQSYSSSVQIEREKRIKNCFDNASVNGPPCVVIYSNTKKSDRCCKAKPNNSILGPGSDFEDKKHEVKEKKSKFKRLKKVEIEKHEEDDKKMFWVK